MSAAGSSPASERMYSKLIDDEAAGREERSRRPDVGHSVFPITAAPRLSGPGPYRLATICLATLCGVLLISIIAVTAHYKNKPEGAGEATAEVQKQTQDASVLMADIEKLRREKAELQKERDELQLSLHAAGSATDVIKPTSKATAAPVVCPVDWHLYNNSCYYISRITRDWPESKSYCESKGAHLAIIHTAEEQTFIWNLLPRGHWNAFWFGITDGDTEDQWRWVDGTPLGTPFWEAGEPNNHINEDCGYIVKTRVLERVATRSWYDAPCSMYWPFICEKEMAAGASAAMPH
ncbi:C-type lectin domain family 4 member E-like isoform X2 [Parambassis ranga]|uniref:C-type lectin domain family 4 member E-like isoform X2 n=1 Tax=Parambassis ranga TaxID=210632 RepID=A0A6P7K3S8_9TELE|nr:C-type lectin domain family 4 member E-like isoform X2 [Parambassis ranga]